MIVSVGRQIIKFIVSATPWRYMLILSACAQDPYKRDSYENSFFPNDYLSFLVVSISQRTILRAQQLFANLVKLLKTYKL